MLQEATVVLDSAYFGMRGNGMTNQRFSKAKIFFFMYILLCFFAFMYHVMRPAADKFSAIFITLLTLPWSVLIVLFIDFIIYPVFHYELNSVVTNLLIFVSVVINALLLYKGAKSG